MIFILINTNIINNVPCGELPEKDRVAPHVSGPPVQVTRPLHQRLDRSSNVRLDLIVCFIKLFGVLLVYLSINHFLLLVKSRTNGKI